MGKEAPHRAEYAAGTVQTQFPAAVPARGEWISEEWMRNDNL